MDLVRLIYASQPFGFDDGMLNGILADARRNNPRRDITGALICRADVYLQLIEGPRAAILTTFERIARDNRHVDVTRLHLEPITQRLFPAWSMKHDPATSWMWTVDEVADGALSRATRDELLAVFERLAGD
jgi:hypothetical protein